MRPSALIFGVPAARKVILPSQHSFSATLRRRWNASLLFTLPWTSPFSKTHSICAPKVSFTVVKGNSAAPVHTEGEARANRWISLRLLYAWPCASVNIRNSTLVSPIFFLPPKQQPAGLLYPEKEPWVLNNKKKFLPKKMRISAQQHI